MEETGGNNEDFEETGEKYVIDAESKYAIVYHGLATKFNLKPTETLIMAVAVSLTQKTSGYCFLSQNSFARLLNVSSITINSNLQKLMKGGLLTRAKRLSEYRTVKWKVSDDVRWYVDHVKGKINSQYQKLFNK